ncbi:hypothetical protein ACSDR0_32795 [Streptosporangium sp. G11]|uniref:hypothetical protein n=1 Tax=Streptosporangium sp. G11 TaxID=3436926 RepID=UPI003EBEE73D
MSVSIRVILAVLFVDELVVGFWNQFFPESFYTDFPTVDLTPPFSEHYARDFGGATLGIALLLGIALVMPRAVFVIPAALAYSMFSIPHFLYHLHHLEGTTTGEAVLLTTANATVALLGVLAVLLAAVRERRDRRRVRCPPEGDRGPGPSRGGRSRLPARPVREAGARLTTCPRRGYEIGGHGKRAPP